MEEIKTVEQPPTPESLDELTEGKEAGHDSVEA